MLVSTYNPDNVNRLGKQTEYQICSKSFDFTAHRLAHMLETTSGAEKIFLEELLKDYRAGSVAVAWCEGQPKWVRVKTERKG